MNAGQRGQVERLRPAPGHVHQPQPVRRDGVPADPRGEWIGLHFRIAALGQKDRHARHFSAVMAKRRGVDQGGIAGRREVAEDDLDLRVEADEF